MRRVVVVWVWVGVRVGWDGCVVCVGSVGLVVVLFRGCVGVCCGVVVFRGAIHPLGDSVGEFVKGVRFGC